MMFFTDIYLSLLSITIIIIGVLVGLAFLTLLERKVLGYIQLRKGPNKVGMIGLLQPFSDAIKLFSKGLTNLSLGNIMIYYYSPIMAFFLSMLIWTVIPFLKLIEYYWGMMFVLAIMSMGVYTVMFSGWASNSNYAMLGSLRAIAQTISYEVSLALIMMFVLFLMKSLSLYNLTMFQMLIWFIILNFPLAMSFFSSMLAETNRTPFDLAEGESELVSGFNIEYSGGGFALIFLAEYSSIIFMSLFFVMLFMGGYNFNIFTYFMVLSLSFMFLWARGTLPRFRYDKLMQLTWKSYLPMSLNFIFLAMGVASLMELN
uniref:NADH-ubiquinone oxidoreductase chain 1 n=1 Tax=Anisolabididae sp. NS-2016 TaxID=1914569 RepID=A0A1J0M497_9NEOP|nr:NADH dehydrogenase subunit 1 [Anisolabididae sp. NS-2016]